MEIAFAPMEGLTDAIYRKTHYEMFGHIDRYFLPFVSPTQNQCWHTRELRNIGTEANLGIPVVPQILTKDPDLFVWAAYSLQEMGHTVVNLNLGCPSGTVTSKGKGAGMLKEPDRLRFFLDKVCSDSPLPVSIKTRIGFDSMDEWPDICSVLWQYPLAELIIHARTRNEFYRGLSHPEAFLEVVDSAPFPVTYNGNLFTLGDIDWLKSKQVHGIRIMLGRGIVSNPALAREMRGGSILQKHELVMFHQALFDAYSAELPKNVVLGKMREICKYLSWCLANADRDRKKMLKASTMDQYTEAAKRLWDTHDLDDVPSYRQESLKQPWP